VVAPRERLFDQASGAAGLALAAGLGEGPQANAELREPFDLLAEGRELLLVERLTFAQPAARHAQEVEWALEVVSELRRERSEHGSAFAAV
jgi:hypothetical protein